MTSTAMTRTTRRRTRDDNPAGHICPRSHSRAPSTMRGAEVRLTRLRRVTLRLYDTATRDVRDFVPLEQGEAGIYVCGLTVQSEPHVGHVRSAVNFDVLRRWLTHQGYAVTFIRNVTDIDDKILAKAVDQGRPWFEIAYLMGRELEKALEAINVLPPTYQPGRDRSRARDPRADRAAGRARPRLRRRGRLGRRLLRRPVVADVRRADPAARRRHGARRRRRPARQARPARLRAVEGLEEGARAGDRGLASALRPRPAGLAHRVLGDGRQVPRPRLRHPRRRRRPALPPPRERAGAVARGGTPVRVVLAAQRLDHHRRREDEQVARQLPADPGRPAAGAGHRAALLHGRRALPLARGVQLRGARRRGRGLPPDRGLPRARRRHRRSPTTLPEAFVAAMDDDLGTPAAVAVDPRRRARGQQGARRRRRRRRTPRGRPRSARCSTCSASTPPTRRGARRPVATTSGSPRRSTRSSSACSPSAARPARPRTSRAPTRSATGSRPPASRSRTPPTVPSGPWRS